MAQLALYQLAFERQESPPAFIKADYYWQDTDLTPPAGRQGLRTDRGLTRSVRLLANITRLDQFAFDINRGKLQLLQNSR